MFLQLDFILIHIYTIFVFPFLHHHFLDSRHPFQKGPSKFSLQRNTSELDTKSVLYSQNSLRNILYSQERRRQPSNRQTCTQPLSHTICNIFENFRRNHSKDFPWLLLGAWTHATLYTVHEKGFAFNVEKRL
jgi:hypothetical protein